MKCLQNTNPFYLPALGGNGPTGYHIVTIEPGFLPDNLLVTDIK